MGIKNNLEIGIQIFLIVMISISFSYILKNSYGDRNELVGGNIGLDSLNEFYKKLIDRIIGSNGLVSAKEIDVYTCVRGNDDSICQEIPIFKVEDIDKCNEECVGECIATSRKFVSECKVGTCFNSNEGTCSEGSTFKECVEKGGEWIDDPLGNVPQCKRGCCILGDQTTYVTDKQCSKQALSFGVEKDFKDSINNELSCYMLSRSKIEGACVFDHDFERTCRFTTKEECIKLTRDRTNFREGFLCSNPDLKTNCIRQKNSKCIEGKDEVYWFDSCGNRENIYEGPSQAKLDRSWNSGLILQKNDSCLLGNSGDSLKNQKSCGNCQYIAGSICGSKTKDESLSDNKQDFVCRDLRCEDNDGYIRENGESWCDYQSNIGIDDGIGTSKGNKLLRSVDSPGSRHFRKLCLDGEIRNQGCADYRNEICVENRAPKDGGGTISSAACKINRWQQCISYNTDNRGQGIQRKTTEKVRDGKCNLNPDCYIKEVNVDKNFKFNICAPKYPPGFDLTNNGDAAEGICSLATQRCTAVYVKKADSSWKCKANCHCEDSVFTEQMNDFCMSVGDCGVSVNYIGDFGFNKDAKSYIKGAPKLSRNYLNGISKYFNAANNKFAEAVSPTTFYESLGPPREGAKLEGESIPLAGLASGIIGASLPWLAAKGYLPGILMDKSSTILSISAESGVSHTPALNALGNVLATSLVLYSAYSLISHFATGQGKDTTALSIVVASIATYTAVAFAYPSLGLNSFGTFFPGLGVVLLVVAIIFKLMGVGKVREKHVDFICQPWQAPLGGNNCDKCGQDDFPCSKYSCQSLGQTCEFVNEGTDRELCIDISPNDVTAPKIDHLSDVLSEGFIYTDGNINGVTIKAIGSEECLKAYEPLTFGISLNEPGLCKLDTEHTGSFDEMDTVFGGRNLFLYNHSQIYSVINLESIIPGFDPSERADHNLYVRCSDKNGNKNENEYVINFCIRPGDDITPPLILSHDPKTEYVSHNSTESYIRVWTNEPSECKWDLKDKKYSEMENYFQCDNSISNRDQIGWICNSTIPIASEVNNLFVRCLDQPWLIESSEGKSAKIIIDEGVDDSGNRITSEIDVDNSRKRNSNKESYIINLKRTKSNLVIERISPDGDYIVKGVKPVSIKIEVDTAEGVDGRSTCSYEISAPYLTRTGDRFISEASESHEILLKLFEGKHKLYVECSDVAGNIVSKTTDFTIDIDDKGPKITRVYNQNGKLTVITNEPSECAYSYKNCKFNFDSDNISIMNGEGLIHSSLFNTDNEYNIKCRDSYNNGESECGLIVRRGNI